MECEAFRLPKSVITDARAIEMPTQPARLSAENTGVGVSQWAAETFRILQEKGDLTMQQNDNTVREHVWEIAQCMSISYKLGASPEQWDLLIDL